MQGTTALTLFKFMNAQFSPPCSSSNRSCGRNRQTTWISQSSIQQVSSGLRAPLLTFTAPGAADPSAMLRSGSNTVLLAQSSESREKIVHATDIHVPETLQMEGETSTVTVSGPWPTNERAAVTCQSAATRTASSLRSLGPQYCRSI